MTVTNFNATVSNSSVSLTWDSTEAYSFVFQDAEIVARLGSGITSWAGPYVVGAVYQAQDSATSTPDPSPENPVPKRRITLFWDEVADAATYEVTVNGVVDIVQAGQASYEYKTNRLPSGTATISIASVDAVGNKSAAGDFTYEIYDVPPRVEGLVLTQSGAGNITATITAPVGW
jgi:hypothetical protein